MKDVDTIRIDQVSEDGDEHQAAGDRRDELDAISGIQSPLPSTVTSASTHLETMCRPFSRCTSLKNHTSLPLRRFWSVQTRPNSTTLPSRPLVAAPTNLANDAHQ